MRPQQSLQMKIYTYIYTFLCTMQHTTQALVAVEVTICWPPGTRSVNLSLPESAAPATYAPLPGPPKAPNCCGALGLQEKGFSILASSTKGCLQSIQNHGLWTPYVGLKIHCFGYFGAPDALSFILLAGLEARALRLQNGESRFEGGGGVWGAAATLAAASDKERLT